MEDKHFEFEIQIAGKRYNASAHKFKVTKRPQIRVVLNPESKKPHIYTFYEVEDKKLFWFDLPNETAQKEAKAIASRLNMMSTH